MANVCIYRERAVTSFPPFIPMPTSLLSEPWYVSDILWKMLVKSEHSHWVNCVYYELIIVITHGYQ